MRRIFVLLVGFLITTNAYSQHDEIFDAPARGFRSWKPAPNWQHALLSGNGTMGAMVMGDPHEETIILSHAKLFLPQKKSDRPIDQASRLDEIRALMLQGKYVEATKIPVAIREAQGYTDERDPFIPAFDLRIEQEVGNIEKYSRTVDFSTGEASVNWKQEKGVYQRKLFVSRHDSIVVLSIKGSGKINAVLRFEKRPVEWQQWKFVNDHIENTSAQASSHWLTYSTTFKQQYPKSMAGYEGVGRLVVHGGKSETVNNQIVVCDADEILLLIKIEPNDQHGTSQIELLKEKLLQKETSYKALLNSHIILHGKLFDHTQLNLHATEEERALDAEAMIVKAQTKVPLAMIEKVYDAGRYNIISATGTYPPNLQGLWSGTWTAPWTSGFTNDGNLAVAISALLTTGTPELLDAFFRYHEGLIEDYRQSAKTLFNTRGIHIPAQTTTSGWQTDFGEQWCLTFWTGAAGWAAHYFYDYYLYTGDKDFLKSRGYPFMKEALLFYEDFLQLDNTGKYIFNPSYSPENNPSNSVSQAMLNATMDVMIAKELIRNCIASAKILKVDSDKVKAWETMLTRMPAYEIATDGSLREWLWPGIEENHKHRHISHLYALYNGVDPDFKKSEVLNNGARRVLEEHMKFRIAEQGGEMSFGLAQMTAVAAHLQDAEQAYTMIQWLSSKYWSSGFGSFHNVRDLFNTDISGGLPYAITQLILQSEVGVVHVLPALPKAWSQGSLTGISLRGQVWVDSIEWNEKEVNVVLKSKIDQPLTFQLPPRTKSATVGKRKVSISKGNSIEIKVKANQPVELTLLY